jgi:hypothetical protein
MVISTVGILLKSLTPIFIFDLTVSLEMLKVFEGERVWLRKIIRISY